MSEVTLFVRKASAWCDPGPFSDAFVYATFLSTSSPSVCSFSRTAVLRGNLGTAVVVAAYSRSLRSSSMPA